MSAKVRTLIVDDSITYRKILTRIVTGISTVELVGTADSGRDALEKIPNLDPQLVLLDIMMPDLDGFETLKEIKKRHPDIEVIMISGSDLENAELTFKSLTNGALDFIPKPNALNMKEGLADLKDALAPLIEVVHHRVTQTGKIGPDKVPAPKPPGPLPEKTGPGKIDLVLIGVSTGGPDALFKMFPYLNKDVRCPILIVQHMPPLFTQSLAEKLDQATHLKVREVTEGMVLQYGHVYVAQGGKHMTLQEAGGGRLRISLDDSPPVNHCKPSIDFLFNSVARIRQLTCLCVIMTGMGRDGTEGVRSLKRNNAYCLIQDEETSVVWGMPGSVFEAQLYDEILPVDQIGRRISKLTSER